MKKLLAALLAVCIMFTGCEMSEEKAEVTTAAVTEAEPQPYPVLVNDISFEKAPETIICLSPALTEILYEMGYGEKLTGRSTYCDYPAEAEKLADIGSSANPDIDKICTVKPELVITSTPIASKDIFTMEQLGIKTLVVEAPESLEQLKSIYQAICLIMEGIFTGKDIGEQAFSVVSKACDNTEVVNIGKFVYITENYSAATGDTLENAVLSCFGENLAENGTKYGFNTEFLVEFQPDVLLVSDIYTYDDIMANELLSQLNAAVNQRIIYIDNSYFERPTARIADMISKLISDYKALPPVQNTAIESDGTDAVIE